MPLPALLDAGVPMALGADDPLLFGSRLAAQYELAREAHGFTDAELAELARQSVRGSARRRRRAGAAAGGDRRLGGVVSARPLGLSGASWRARDARRRH